MQKIKGRGSRKRRGEDGERSPQFPALARLENAAPTGRAHSPSSPRAPWRGALLPLSLGSVLAAIQAYYTATRPASPSLLGSPPGQQPTSRHCTPVSGEREDSAAERQGRAGRPPEMDTPDRAAAPPVASRAEVTHPYPFSLPVSPPAAPASSPLFAAARRAGVRLEARRAAQPPARAATVPLPPIWRRPSGTKAGRFPAGGPASAGNQPPSPRANLGAFLLPQHPQPPLGNQAHPCSAALLLLLPPTPLHKRRFLSVTDPARTLGSDNRSRSADPQPRRRLCSLPASSRCVTSGFRDSAGGHG